MNSTGWNRKGYVLPAIFVALLAVLWSPALAPGEERIDPLVERILRQSCDTLEEAGEFTFNAEVTYDDLLYTGQKVQYSGQLETALRRPDRVRTHYQGDRVESATWYDGRSFTIMDTAEGLFASTEAPDSIDALLGETVPQLGFSLELSDFLYSKPCSGLLAGVESAIYAGLESVKGRNSHHLAFTQADIDWQVWIEKGTPPVPRKLVITYKKLPGAPQYTAVIGGWDFAPGLSDAHFTFDPPENAERVEFLEPPGRDAGR